MMRRHIALLAIVVLSFCNVSPAAEVVAEPGPVAGGLRMRLLVMPNAAGEPEGFRVQVDVINSTAEPIVIRADRTSSRIEGGFEAQLEAAVSIESYPAIEPWLGQVMLDPGKNPAPEKTLAAGETLSLKWQTTGKRLKNRVTNPLDIQDPEFIEDGLYSIHATLAVKVSGRSVLLRSNEQLVAVGGSRELPKHTYGRLWWAEEKSRKAEIGLGSRHKVAAGDRFLIHTGTIGMNWTLTITEVQDDRSNGTLEPSQASPLPWFPQSGTYAALVRTK